MKITSIKHRSAMLLPNLLTTTALLTAFYSLVATWEQNYVYAAIAIIIAAFLDAFDGRVARFTRSTSSFGEHYDSLADVIAFGVAPAFLAFGWGIHHFSEAGIALCFVYVACCCMRLARFSTGDEGKYKFRGMPSPTGGGYIASLIWLLETYPMPEYLAQSIIVIALPTVGLLMVSSLPFISGRSFRFLSRSHSGPTLLLVIFYFGLLIAYPPETLLVSGCLYIFLALAYSARRSLSEHKKIVTTKYKISNRAEKTKQS